jgi:acetyl-CoA carboxylase biotin carboxyl carrier protein
MKRVPVKADTEANVWQIRCAVGDRVSEGQELVILESMKMEIPVESPAAGTVQQIAVKEGDTVKEGALVAVIESD